jgi:hypothetical protein
MTAKLLHCPALIIKEKVINFYVSDIHHLAKVPPLQLDVGFRESAEHIFSLLIIPCNMLLLHIQKCFTIVYVSSMVLNILKTCTGLRLKKSLKSVIRLVGATADVRIDTHNAP